MGEFATFVSAGGAGALLLGFAYLLTANRRDRRDYQEAVDKAEARADAAEQRTRDAYALADEARAGRHACEDALAALRQDRERP